MLSRYDSMKSLGAQVPMTTGTGSMPSHRSSDFKHSSNHSGKNSGKHSGNHSGKPSKGKYIDLKKRIIEKYTRYNPVDSNVVGAVVDLRSGNKKYNSLSYLRGDMYAYLKQCPEYASLKPIQLQTYINAWLADPEFMNIDYDVLGGFISSGFFGVMDENYLEIARRDFIEVPWQMSKSYYTCEPGKLCFIDDEPVLEGNPDEMAQALFEELKKQHEAIFGPKGKTYTDALDNVNNNKFENMQLYDAYGRPMEAISMPLTDSFYDPFYESLSGKEIFDFHSFGPMHLPDYAATYERVSDDEDKILNEYLKNLKTQNSDPAIPEGILIGGGNLTKENVLKFCYDDVRRLEVCLYAAAHARNYGVFMDALKKETERFNSIANELTSTPAGTGTQQEMKNAAVLTYMFHYVCYIFNHVTDNDKHTKDGNIFAKLNLDISSSKSTIDELKNFADGIYKKLDDSIKTHDSLFNDNTRVPKKNMLNQILLSDNVTPIFYKLTIDLNHVNTSSDKLLYIAQSVDQINIKDTTSTTFYKNYKIKYVNDNLNLGDRSFDNSTYSMYPWSYSTSGVPSEYRITTALSFMQNGYRKFIQEHLKPEFETYKDLIARSIDAIGCSFDFIIIKCCDEKNIDPKNCQLYAVKC